MDPIILIFITTATGSFGFLLGFMVRALTRRKAESADPDVDPNPLPDSIAEQEQDVQQQLEGPAIAKKAPKRNLIEVANLWRDRRNGGLVFQIEDQYFNRGDELTTRERELLLKIVMDFYGWLEPPSTTPSYSNPSEKPDPTFEGPQVQDQGPKISPSTELPESSQEESAKQKKEKFSPVNFVARALSSEVTRPSPPAPSMVAQVDSILQEKLHAADMKNWAVLLRESPNKGMVVLVGLEKYTDIEDVPYERVRSIIRASVAEWERRTEAGDKF